MLPATKSLQQSQCNIGFSGEALTSGNKQRKIACKPPVGRCTYRWASWLSSSFSQEKAKGACRHSCAYLASLTIQATISYPTFLSPIFETLALFLILMWMGQSFTVLLKTRIPDFLSVVRNPINILCLASELLEKSNLSGCHIHWLNCRPRILNLFEVSS